jgi:hypothetical protein
LLVTLLLLFVLGQSGVSTPAQPYVGLTFETEIKSAPRPIRVHVASVDLTAPGIRVSLTGPEGPLEVIRRTTLESVRAAGAALGINAHFFLPFPSATFEADLIGIAASEGRVYSAFEWPVQNYALVRDAPGLNIDRLNRAAIVRRDSASPDGRRVLGGAELWTTVSGSAQIVTDGRVTIPEYRDASHPDGALTPGGPGAYSNDRSWYEAINARSAIGISRDGRMLTLVSVDARGGSQGMTVRELAEWLVGERGVYQALNLDGGGSTSMAIADPLTGQPRLVTTSADGAAGRAVGSSLLVFARRR